MDADKNENSAKSHGFASWLVSVLGWLICAGLCLALLIGLESYPYAYDMLFPAPILILFCNILLFLFVTSRYGKNLRQLFFAVFRICLGEGLLLVCLYVLGRFAIGS